jgi:hypothetical protein
MKYFDTLPKIVSTDDAGNAIVMTNLLTRASIISSTLTDPLIYYNYDLQDGDTPEIVAHKYYGDVYRYWIVLASNQLIDPQWDWPLSGSVLSQYISNKYVNINVYTTIHHYEKIILQYDVDSGTTTKNIINISSNEYDTLVDEYHSYSLPTGTVQVSTTKRAVNLFDYELETNEKKRQIKLLNKNYVNQFEDELKKLMK